MFGFPIHLHPLSYHLRNIRAITFWYFLQIIYLKLIVTHFQTFLKLNFAFESRKIPITKF